MKSSKFASALSGHVNNGQIVGTGEIKYKNADIKTNNDDFEESIGKILYLIIQFINNLMIINLIVLLKNYKKLLLNLNLKRFKITFVKNIIKNLMIKVKIN